MNARITSNHSDALAVLQFVVRLWSVFESDPDDTHHLLVFDYPDGPFFNTFEWNERDSTWTFRLESVAKDGTRQLFAIDRLRR